MIHDSHILLSCHSMMVLRTRCTQNVAKCFWNSARMRNCLCRVYQPRPIHNHQRRFTTQRHLHTHIHTLCLAGYDTFIILHATFYFGDTSQSMRICVYILVYIYTHGDTQGVCACVPNQPVQPACSYASTQCELGWVVELAAVRRAAVSHNLWRRQISLADVDKTRCWQMS